MKKRRLIPFAALALTCGLMAAGLAGCGGPADELSNNTDSTVKVDAGITIDGTFDESFYTGRNWLTLNKRMQQSGQTETGTLEMTTYFSETGIVVAAHIVDSRAAVSGSSVATSDQTCFSGYFAFGDTTSTGGGVYEVENTASNLFKISEFVAGELQVMNTEPDVTPVHAVHCIGDLQNGECYEYYVEYFMPYALFGRSSVPDTVYFNPTMISATLDDNGEAIDDLRTWYNFGEQQSALYGWGKPNSGYVFDDNGFVSNSLDIEESEGGSVTEEWGYDWTVTGDRVNLKIAADKGYKLTSLRVNGEECIDEIVAGVYFFTATGDTTVVPVFTAVEVENIVVSDVYAWIDYPASEFTLELNNGESDYTLEYDTSKLSIDKERKTVKALDEGMFEVKVTSGSDTATFDVICSSVNRSGTGKWDSSSYAQKAADIKSRYASYGNNGSTTVFLGDSFFDNTERNWSNFYTTYAREKDALELGIGGTTTYDWENFLSGGILDRMQPKNLVVNLGTNNLAADLDTTEGLAENLQRLFTLLHDKMPNTNIYYLSIAQRVDTTSYGRRISAVNDLMEQWCEYKDWITFVDVEGRVGSSDLKDGLHPKDGTYTNIYVPALEAAGCVVEKKIV